MGQSQGRSETADPPRTRRARAAPDAPGPEQRAVPAPFAAATAHSPLGPLTVATTPAGVAALAYGELLSPDVCARLAARPAAGSEGALDPAAVQAELADYLAGRRRAFSLPVDWQLVGSDFVRRVLAACAAIPWGERRTYGELAAAAGAPQAARAVGNAMAANPLPIIVPCHRVVAAGGGLGGYSSGIWRKRWLLTLEGQLPQ